MADIQGFPLKVMFIFEAASRIGCGSEVACLATNIYHRFNKVRLDINNYDPYIFAAACIKLAHMYYEKPLDLYDLILVVNSIQNGTDVRISKSNKSKLIHSIESAANVIQVYLDFQINHNVPRMQQQSQVPQTQIAPKPLDEEPPSDSDDDSCEEVDQVDMDAILLVNNSKSQISSHRYLVHYLTTIKMLINEDMSSDFKIVCDIAWGIVSDVHWRPRIVDQPNNHIACIALMMAIEIVMPFIMSEYKVIKKAFAEILNLRKWNLIFCDNLNDVNYRRLRDLIIRDYREYERVLQYQFNTFVIDPSTSNRRL